MSDCVDLSQGMVPDTKPCLIRQYYQSGVCW